MASTTRSSDFFSPDAELGWTSGLRFRVFFIWAYQRHDLAATQKSSPNSWFLTDSSLQQNPFKVPGLLGKEEHESPELTESSSCFGGL